METSKITQNLYTIKEAAVFLGRSPWSVRELIWAGHLPVVRTRERGKQWIRRSSLDSFVQKFERLENTTGR